MVQKLKLIVKYLISMTSQPEHFWAYLDKGKDPMSKPDYMQSQVFIPMLGIFALLLFAIAGFSGEGFFDLQHAMIFMVPRLVAYFAGPYIAMFLLKEISPKYLGAANPDHDRLQLYVFYSTGYLMTVEIVMALIPSIKFLQMASYYLIYITWTGAIPMIKVPEKKQWIFGFVAFLLIYLVPYGIKWLVSNMQTQ